MQRWLITGSSRGMGRAISQAVLDAGHQLVATARDTTRLADLVEQYGEAVRIITLDVTDPVAAEAAVRLAMESFVGLDVLVNSAGYGNVGSVEDTDLYDFRRQIETNLFGTIIMTKAVIPVMREQRSGHIIQFSSVGGRIGALGRAAYSAAKWGVEGFSEALALEMALIGVGVTILEPGGFRTDFAGSSTVMKEGNPIYDKVIGATIRSQRAYNCHQPGDPQRAAQVILEVSSMERPPLRLPLGTDAVTAIRRADLERLEEVEKWREMSIVTDFPSGGMTVRESAQVASADALSKARQP
ncbi:SDR family NAD(P)-dependent oxidoreductase [Novacetimonas pomaceti]|uniref:SDR family NAD(P)-dependent oxidoreductase n=1 Tax=Novacetimonas pomaceti TaxID=2021998 RepID=UPI001C2DC0AC|nr:SDR family NAD(P)-dependent oxidoreductase [Novacetimonas pomaceti]MBV1834131.1 SDR family NAD(P)-dependent oxidoreductase [Novacetimonas pomaceti]